MGFHVGGAWGGMCVHEVVVPYAYACCVCMCKCLCVCVWGGGGGLHNNSIQSDTLRHII